MSPRRLAPLAALCLGAAVAAGACGASPRTKPLSTLGPLRPAPDPGPLGSELVPIPQAPRLAPAASLARPGKSVDGIKCERNARLLFHVHTHVTVFVKGSRGAIPAGVGVWPPLGPQELPPRPVRRHRRELPHLAQHPLRRRADPRRVVDQAVVHARRLLRCVGSAARTDPRRPRARQRDRDRRRPGLDGRPTRDPARLAHADPARGRHAARRPADDRVSRRLLTTGPQRDHGCEGRWPAGRPRSR